MEQVLKKEKQIQAKPIMKWAGGKTQMLGDIMPKIPQKYGKYIEPFIGGGALFFALLILFHHFHQHLLLQVAHLLYFHQIYTFHHS